MKKTLYIISNNMNKIFNEQEYMSADALSMSLRAEEQMIDAFGTCYLNGNKMVCILLSR